MNQKSGRLAEYLVHGIPYYLGSNTPDGRIVGELYKSRQQDERYQDKQLVLQENLSKKLVATYGQSTVPASDFLEKVDTTNQLLREHSGQLYDIYREQARTNESINTLSEVTGRGLAGTISELQGVRSDMQSMGDRLHYDLNSVDASVNGLNHSVQQGTRTLHGANYPLSVNKVMQQEGGFENLLAAYTKGMLGESVRSQVESRVDTQLKKNNLSFSAVEKVLKQKLPDSAETNGLINEAMGLVHNPSKLLRQGSDKSFRQLSVLEQATPGNPELSEFIASARGLLSLAHTARYKPLSRQTLIDYSNGQLLNDEMLHAIKETTREARNSGTQIDINYNLKEANAQREVSNLYLSQLVYNASATNSHLIDLKGIAHQNTRTLHGPTYPSLSVAEAMRQPDGVTNLLAVYARGMLCADAQSQIEQQIDQQLRIYGLSGSAVEKALRRKLSGSKVDERTISDAVGLVSRPSNLLRQDADKSKRALSALQQAADIEPELSEFVERAHAVLDQYQSAIDRPVARQALIDYSNGQLLNDRALHAVREYTPEARKTGSLVDINYNLMDVSKHLIDTNGCLTDISDQLNDANSHLIDLKQLAVNHSRIVWMGFQGLGGQLQAIGELLSSRHLDLVRTLAAYNEAIIGKLEYGNALLEDLVSLNRESLHNEARQHFNDGITCLRNAENNIDFEDAYKAFSAGIEKVRASAENHLGAGLAAEELLDWEKAVTHYERAGKRTSDPVLAAHSWQRSSKLYQAQNNYRKAIEAIDRAIANQPDIEDLRYEKIQLLVLSAREDEAISAILDLINLNNDFIYSLRIDPTFAHFPVGEIYRRIWRTLPDPNLRYYLLRQMLALKDEETAMPIFQSLANNYPMLLVREKVWSLPLFDRISDRAKTWLIARLDDGVLRSPSDQRYAMATLMFHLGASCEQTWRTFQSDLQNDVAYFRKQKLLLLQRLRDAFSEDGKDMVMCLLRCVRNEMWLYEILEEV